MGNETLVNTKGKYTVGIQIKQKTKVYSRTSTCAQLEQTLMCGQVLENGFFIYLRMTDVLFIIKDEVLKS